MSGIKPEVFFFSQCQRFFLNFQLIIRIRDNITIIRIVLFFKFRIFQIKILLLLMILFCKPKKWLQGFCVSAGSFLFKAEIFN